MAGAAAPEQLAPRRGLRRLRGLALAAAASAALGVGAAPFLSQRAVVLRLQLHGAGPAWALQWGYPDGTRNGAWLDGGTAPLGDEVDVAQRIPWASLTWSMSTSEKPILRTAPRQACGNGTPN